MYKKKILYRVTIVRLCRVRDVYLIPRFDLTEPYSTSETFHLLLLVLPTPLKGLCQNFVHREVLIFSLQEYQPLFDRDTFVPVLRTLPLDLIMERRISP